MAQEFADAFDETGQTALVSHTPDVGASWTILATSAAGAVDIRVTTGLADPTGTTASAYILTRADITGGISSADYKVTATVNVSNGVDDTHGMTVRMADLNNMYAANISGANAGKPELYKLVSGVATLLGTSATRAFDGDQFTLTVSATQLILNQAGVNEISTTDSDLSAAGAPGWHWGNLFESANDILATDEILDMSVETFEAGVSFVQGNIILFDS